MQQGAKCVATQIIKQLVKQPVGGSSPVVHTPSRRDAVPLSPSSSSSHEDMGQQNNSQAASEVRYIPFLSIYASSA